MYRLFEVAQAREFSVGCQAKWSNFVMKSKAFPFVSAPELSVPFHRNGIPNMSVFWVFYNCSKN